MRPTVRTCLLTCLLAILLLANIAEGTTRYVKVTGTGTRDGSSWANAGPPSGQTALAWVNSIMVGGDTMYFAPGTYLGELRPPTNTNSNDRTCYSASDGTTANRMYDPGVLSLAANPTREQFEQSLLVAKACTLTSATRLAPGTTWTNYSGNIYYASASLLPFRFWPTDRGYTGGQDTTLLIGRADLGSMTQGSFYHDISNSRVYVWCTDNTNPTTHTIWASSSCTIDFDGLQNSNYVTFYGFDIRWNYYASVHLGASGVDSVFVDHCRITKIYTQQASNAGIVGCQHIESRSDCGGDYDCTYASDGKWNRIRACYGAQIYEPGRDPNRCKLITTYSQSHMVVESCLAVGIGGVDWKNQAAGGSSYGNTFRFNTVRHWPTSAYENLCGHNQQDSCYGNYFIGDPTNNDMKAIWFEWTSLGGNTQHGSGHFVANNVFYQCQTAIATGIFDDYDQQPNWIKYNIFYGGGQADYSQMHYQFSNDTNYISDSNLYFNLPTNHINRNGTSMSLATWQTYRSGNWAGAVLHDLHSVTYDPEFANAAGYDFSRPSSDTEMVFDYGGKRWTRFGAWQPGGGNPPQGLNWIQADSLRCDYSGENDSLRFRFLSSTQTWPDSAIVAISLVTNTLPSYAQGSDRWARPYRGASRLDTLFISRLINESDTIVVGGWVRDNDSGMSAGVFDTIILTQPVVAPAALTALTLDSLRGDFSNENDSLRISYSTGTQTFPDSVIFAITTNGALPTVSSADRMAGAYTASTNGTIPIVRTITESDTLIIGGWVKDGSTYSTARYDTLILTLPTTSALSALALDSARSDFSGESDSLRIRYVTTSQTFPDSVILALTTNGTLPTTSSADRWARAYVPSRTDTSFAIRTITETDTLILGAWVKDGSTYSAARYDTLVLAQPSLSGLTSLIIDSTRSDYSGEADSLRIRYVTTAQTFPDSVILALTTNGSLPTTTGVDRWARAYVASKTDTSFVVRAVAESDTLIVAAWVKDGSSYSSPRYDTVMLIQPTTNPVASAFLDSIRCDFASENDSLRLRYTTGSQTFPDSIIYAISLTGTLPTQSQSSDRMARAYTASRTDSVYIVKGISETDTVIVGVWVKDATIYSSGRYDTLIITQPATSPLATLAADSLRNDFSAENDSLRIRYTTSAQIFPDTVILALTTNGTLPTTSSADRWARAYVGSRTDTTFAIRAFTEPDTIIIGAWVKDAAGTSTGRFDTIIYVVPQATAPEPLALLAADSLRSDFAGENDSLRFRWQTGAQTTPDSVILVLSNDGQLPGVNGSDRLAVPYVSSITDTVILLRSITESDTIIVGGWAKDGSAYSTPLYDTIILFSPAPEPLVSLALDSLRSDYALEIDSLRIRFTSGGQTWPDSTVFALTTNGTLPQLTAGDRWSRPYTASTTDTLFITRAVTEPATLILGAWVREGGSWSTPVYDTLQVALPAPQPLVFVVVDSVNYDYSGENDSLRFVYRTGSETWPDSVIVAASFTSALPTLSSSDRWARRYVAGASQAFMINRLINEPDTLIIGGWVKVGNQVSAPIYDTIPLTPTLVHSNIAITDISASSAVISWTTNLLATSQVEWGTTTAYGFASTRDANKVLNHTVVITGLSAATTYHLRLLSDPGDGTRYSDDTSFVTSLATGSGVTITNDEAWFVTDSSALIVWHTSAPATSQVQYGARGRYKKVTPEDRSYAVDHAIYLRGLSPKTTYKFRAVSADPSGTRTIGQDRFFTTPTMTSKNLAVGKAATSRADGSSSSPAVVVDDIIDTCGATSEIWISDDNKHQPQWVEIDLGADSLVSEVIVYWACDTLGETWLTSQQYSIQMWNGSAFQDAATLISPEIDHATVTGFPDTLRTSRLRIYQPDNMGSADHPARLALTEVQVYGAEHTTPVDTSSDLVTQSPSAFNVSQPILRVENLTDSIPTTSGYVKLVAGKSAADHFYYFSVANDTNMFDIVATSPAVPQEDGDATSWKVPFPLEANRTYYWQVSLDSLVFSTVYAITVTPQTHAYPNPFKMDQEDQVVFTGIPTGSSLIIISISGEVVKRWTDNSGEDIPWDGRNESGHTVSSGVYLWYIEDSDIKGQLIVLR